MFKTASKLFLLALALAETACGGVLAEPFTPPESGGYPWVEVTSKHVVLRSDLSESDAREACVEFERIYQMFEDIAFPYADKPQTQTSIVLLRSEAEYKVIGPPGSAGFFHRAVTIDDYFEPTAIFYGDLTAKTRVTFQHELTHRFLDFYFPTRPVWFDEGMADYYSTMQVEGDKVVLGRDVPSRYFRGGLTWSFERTPMWNVAHVPVGSALSVNELLSISRSDFYSNRDAGGSPSEKEDASKRQTANYTSAWALVNLLLNGPKPYPELFQAYLEKLAANVSPDRAFANVFGSVESRLEADYRAWLAPKDRILRTSSYELPAAADVSLRAMDPADVHVLWASIWPTRSDEGKARVRAELDAAIQLDPKKSSARVWMAQLEEDEARFGEAEKHLTQALSAAPNDAAATYALFRMLVRRASYKGASEDLWKRADELLPKVVSVATSARILNGAARYLALRSREDEGLPLAVRAASRDPSCWQCFDTLGLLLAQKGDFAKAQQVQLIAVSLIPENIRASGPEERLRLYAKKASTAAAAPSCPSGESCAPPVEPGVAPSGEAAGEFNRSAATTALGSAASEAKKCKQAGGPTGSGKVKVTFQPTGLVSAAEVLGPPFAGTPTGECIMRAFKAIHVPPYTENNQPVKVIKSFAIP